MNTKLENKYTVDDEDINERVAPIKYSKPI